MDPPAETLMQRLRGFLGPFAADHGFVIDARGDRASSLEAWIRLESRTIIRDVIRDRGDEYFVVAAKVRPGPRGIARSAVGHYAASPQRHSCICSIETVFSEEMRSHREVRKAPTSRPDGQAPGTRPHQQVRGQALYVLLPAVEARFPMTSVRVRFETLPVSK